MVFAAIRVGHKPIIFICDDEKINSDKYHAMMVKTFGILQRRYGANHCKQDFIWQQDGAPAHRSYKAFNYLSNKIGENAIIGKRPETVMDYQRHYTWAPGSPDLSQGSYCIRENLVKCKTVRKKNFT